MNEFWLTAGEAPTASELEEAIADIARQAPYKLHLRGDFKTRGLVLPNGCQLYLEGARIALDPDSVTDDQITDEPLVIVGSAMRFGSAIPRGESVKGGTIVANYSALKLRYEAKGKVCRPWGVVLQGHQASVEGVKFEDFGAFGAEAFCVLLCGARHPDDVTTLPVGTLFEEAYISGCALEVPTAHDSDNQVTAFLIMGGASAARQLMRSSASITDCVVRVSGSPAENRVQAATLYQCFDGKVSGAVTPGCNAGYYGDSYSTRGVEISDNDFRGTWKAIRLLSGGEQASHDDYVIQRNLYGSLEEDVELDTLGPPTDKRHINNIVIEAGARVRNSGATNVRQLPIPTVAQAAGRRGCF